LAPRVPYCAVLAASRNTVIDSMSCVLIAFRFPAELGPSAMPLTTISASSSPMNVVVPRSFTIVRPSAVRENVRPGTFEMRICSSDIPGCCAMSSAVITMPDPEGRAVRGPDPDPLPEQAASTSTAREKGRMIELCMHIPW